MQTKNKTYLNNPKLKAAGVKIEFTAENAAEYAKCARDPIYFIENYCKVVSLDKGLVLMKLYPYQKRLIKAFHTNDYTIGRLFRQAGKSTVTAAYITWYCIFNDLKKAAILANKESTAKEIFSRVQLMIEELPRWLQQGVVEWNKKSFELENGTKCFCAASSPSAVRGDSISLLMLDEFAFLRPALAEEFIASVFPTISSSESAKMIIVSTPKGMNHFWKLWCDAEKGINGFTPVQGKWQEHPDRTEKWAKKMWEQLGEVKYNQEILCTFLGSSNTLIRGERLSALTYTTYNELLPNFRQFEAPIKGHQYVILVDTSRGSDLDKSAFVVIDISVSPYNVVATYYDASISTLVYPELIFRTAIQYNDAFVLVETNDLGQEVANILYYDLEYENLYMSSKDEIKEGGGKSYLPGCKTTKRTKSIGCNMLKNMVETEQLVLNDERIITEATTFVRVGTSYKAEDGKHDDLMMCLVMFGFLASTPIFQELFTFSLRKKLASDQLSRLEEQMLPVGFLNRAGEEEPTVIVEPRGDTLWLGNTNMQDFINAFS